MSEERRPGPVTEKTSRIGRPGHPAQEPEEGDIASTRTQARTRGLRKPGPEEGPTEAIPEDRAQDDPQTIPPMDPPRASPWFSVLWLLLACVAFWGIASMTLNLVELWYRHTVIAIPMGLAGAALIILLARAMWREWQAMRDVDALGERREAIDGAIDGNDMNRLKSALGPTLSGLKSSRPALIDEFERAVVDMEDCRDYLHTLENLVLRPLDEEAHKVVKQGSISTAAAVAIVPHPAFDAVVVLWRTLVMTRRIGGIYGLRPGGLSSWRLLSYSIKSALLAAAMDTLTSMAADASANAVASAVKPLAEGAVIGVRVYRFGQIAIGICRPVAKSPDRQETD